VTRVEVNDHLARVDGKLVYSRFIIWRGVEFGGMEERELPPGPWHDESDHVEFEHLGHPCILHRGPTGAWCGYVAVPPGHPWHGRGFDWKNGVDADVHGGITYANACQGSICHVAKPGEPDDVWWLGFDCNHLGDMDAQKIIEDGGVYGHDGMWPRQYRTVGYVRRETEKLAEQAKEAA
jgi:hypothetical protein